jgi:hypothetical protein
MAGIESLSCCCTLCSASFPQSTYPLNTMKSDYAAYQAWVQARQANLVPKAEGKSDLKDTVGQNQAILHQHSA